MSDFTQTVLDHYDQHRRELPWRDDVPMRNGQLNPYHITLSEVMLQQTQAARVAPKYFEFLQKFPDWEQLAGSSLGSVLGQWQGLGYNRRAKYLWEAGQLVCKNGWHLEFPESAQEVSTLPGIGLNTAGAICTYVFDEPHVFIETNIRTVYIYHFFPKAKSVSDNELLPIISKHLHEAHQSVGARTWNWALMDYGAHLKKQHANPSRASKHYTLQSKFAGSNRQLRGAVLRILSARGEMQALQLLEELDDVRLSTVLDALVQEGLVQRDTDMVRLP